MRIQEDDELLHASSNNGIISINIETPNKNSMIRLPNKLIPKKV